MTTRNGSSIVAPSKWFRRSGHAYEDIRLLLASVEQKGLCLDMPSGKGVNYEGIGSAGFNSIEADMFPRREGPPEASRVKMDFSDPLPFDSGSFAAVLCSEGIEHHPAQTDLIREFRRVLAPGGSLLITTPNTLNLRARLAIALHGNYSYKNGPISEATKCVPAHYGTGTYLGHVHMIDYFELRFILKTNGFDVVQLTTAKYSGSSMLLLPLMYLPVWFATRMLLSKHLGKYPENHRDLLRGALSRDLLLGKRLIVLARRVD